MIFMKTIHIIFAIFCCLPTARVFSMDAPLDKAALNKQLLEIAALQDAPEKITSLIKQGADLEAKDSMWRTPLYLATAGGHVNTAQALLDAGADIHTRDIMGWTLLDAIFHTESSSIETLKLLIAKGIKLNEENKRGTHPIIRAIDALWHKNSEKKIEVLLNAPVNTAIKDQYGNSLLHMAAENKRSKTIAHLLTMGFSVHERNKYLETPLHRVPFQSAFAADTIRTLIQAGADRSALCKDGKTPLDVAYRMFRKYPSSTREITASLRLLIVTIQQHEVRHIIPALIVLTYKEPLPNEKLLPQEICEIIRKQLITVLIEEKLALAKKYIPAVDSNALYQEIKQNINSTIKKLPRIESKTISENKKD